MKNTKLFYAFLIGACALGLAGNLFAAEVTATNSTQAISQSPGFREGLAWTGSVAPTETESAALLKIIQRLDQPDWTTNLEMFLQAYPHSPWAASLHHAYASFCHRTGRTTKALEHWEAGWRLVKHDTSGAGQRVGGEILANWAEQLSSLGRRDKLQELIPEGDKWPFASHQDREKFESAKHNYYLMGSHPEISFRCGTLALKAVGLALQPRNESLEELVGIPSPTNGFNVGALARFANQYGLNLVPVRRTQGEDLIVPSVVHWRQNHYAAILQQTNGNYLVNDPTFGQSKWIQAEAINEEASGVFLIPAKAKTNGWETLSDLESQTTLGKGLPNNVNDAQDCGCAIDAAGQVHCSCPGMPVWWVSEPYINVWMADEPLSYLTSRGEPFTFRFSYKQRDSRPQITAALGGGVADIGWNCSWFSSVRVDSTTVYSGGFAPAPTVPSCPASLYLGNGGEVDFASGQTYDQKTHTLLQGQFTQQAGGDNGVNGVVVIRSDGSQDIYGTGVSSAHAFGDFYFINYLLTRHIDPHGNVTTISYHLFGGQYLPQYIVDYDGLTNTFTYTMLTGTNVGGLYVPATITNAYGKGAQLKYESATGNLTNITDAQGLSSSMTYDSNGYPTSLITPYGTNQFALYVNPGLTTNGTGDGNMGILNSVERAAVITDPIAGQHLYLYRYDSSTFMPSNYPPSDVPTNTPLGTLDSGTGGTNALDAVSYRNSFSWNAKQYASLSTTNFLTLSSNDFLRGRMQHWLQDSNDLTLSGYLSVERDPSPDGTTEGLKRFYDYQGKTYPHRSGTNAVPSLTAWRLPGGETHYEYVQYNYFGVVTNQVATFTTSGGALSTRTNQFIYADNTYSNVIYQQYFSPSNFFLPFRTNTFKVPDLLTGVVAPNGSNILSAGPFDVVASTNFFQLDTSGDTNLYIQYSRRVAPDFLTNAVGDVTAFTFTNFDRIASIQWPAGLTTTNIYAASGFLSQTIDLQIQRTNSYAFSTNGLPSIHTNELGLVTQLFWDNLLRLTGIVFPDATSVSNTYSRLDLAATKDRLGNLTHYSYDGLRHLLSVTNANNAVTSYSWCDCGALNGITDALTKITTLSYDMQDRLTNILFPDSSSISYQYDLAGRNTNITDGATNSVSLIYNNQGLTTNRNNIYGPIGQAIFDILDRPVSFTDANGITVTNAFDMLNRLTTHVWTVDGLGEEFVYSTNGLTAYTNRNNQVTRYVRDAAARLIAVTNANLEVTHFAYDALDHIKTLTDGLSNVTTWNYNQFGWLTNKVDATNHEIFHFYYDADGRMTNRSMLGSGDTGYAYDAVGNLTNVIYSNSLTAAISYYYDADNRLTNLLDGVGTTAFTYTETGQLKTESGPWATNTLTYGYSQGHRTNLSLTLPAGGTWAQTYLYDNVWRLTNLTSAAGAFTYGYPASASALIQSLALPNTAGITYQYDSLARLTNTSLANLWGHVLDGYGYGYDLLGQRTNISRNLGLTTNRITAEYDNIGQLTSWAAQEANGAARLNEQLGYGYDAGGNLHLRTNNALVQTFGVDTLNQLTTVSRTGTLTVSGATPVPAPNVTVNGSAAHTYGDFTFAGTGFSLTNGVNNFTNVAQNVYGTNTTNIITANLPTPVTFQYDNNGNLTNDGTRNFIYDAENQLTNVNVPSTWKTEYVYDGLRRKRLTRDYTWSGSWVRTNETRYIYDRMLPIQERNSNNVVKVTYTLGLDLSLTLQRAGGIGGLLARTDANGSTFYHADGSGNVTGLIDTNQNIVARYEYDPFGKLIGKWGPLADVNTYRFSSKEFQRSSGLYSYEFRFYEPNFQRWLNRDPIGINGGFNGHRFARNNPLRFIDPSGLAEYQGDLWDDMGGNYDEANANVEGGQFLDQAIRMSAESYAAFMAGGIVSLATGGIADEALGPGLAAGAVSGLAGDAAYQGVNMGFGNQDGFNANEFAMAGVGGSVLGAVGAKTKIPTPTECPFAEPVPTPPELPPVVIGRNMDRVIPFAKANGFDYYIPPEGLTPEEWLPYNAAQIQEWQDQGRTFIDIGPDPNNPTPSKYYNMESSMVSENTVPTMSFYGFR